MQINFPSENVCRGKNFLPKIFIDHWSKIFLFFFEKFFWGSKKSQIFYDPQCSKVVFVENFFWAQKKFSQTKNELLNIALGLRSENFFAPVTPLILSKGRRKFFCENFRRGKIFQKLRILENFYLTERGGPQFNFGPKFKNHWDIVSFDFKIYMTGGKRGDSAPPLSPPDPLSLTPRI